MKMKKISIFSMFIVMIGALCVAGCGDDAEMTNSQPTIDRVIVPKQVKAGEEVKLEVVAHDADGDKLTYKWKVSDGTVNAAGVWTVPREPMNTAVLVHVSDGVNPSVASAKISVEILPPSEPIAPKGMVLIPVGEFQMGNDAQRALNNEQPVRRQVRTAEDVFALIHDTQRAANNEQPVHTVYLNAFFMDEHEVTNFEYQQFVRANPSWQKDKIDERFHNGNYLKDWTKNAYPSGKTRHPVVYVSWYAAMAYAQWQSKRLPTEAEWEYAARGGLAGKRYPWGDKFDHDKLHIKPVGDPTRATGDTAKVGQYPPNGYGLYDMAGNVWEWCLDEYNADFYFTSPRENPFSGANGLDWVVNNFIAVESDRVLRGGSWYDFGLALRVHSRSGKEPLKTYFDTGFRCVKTQ